MKKVLSVALASAMVLGMGVSSFAITYSTGSNDEADWPKNFQFDGELFVTDKDGDIIEEATTELNDSEAVDFEPGDVIWMPLYADNQKEYTADWTPGKDEVESITNIALVEGDDYVEASDEKKTAYYDGNGSWYTSQNGTLIGTDAQVTADGWRNTTPNAAAGTYTLVKAGNAPHITVPTEVKVTVGNTTVARKVVSAKVTVDGKTYKGTPAELNAIFDADLWTIGADGVRTNGYNISGTVTTEKIAATDDVVGKPEVDNTNGVVLDYGHYTGNIDKNWSINLIEKSTGVSELIAKAELYKATATDYASYSEFTDEIMPNAGYLKITLEDEWKTVDEETLTYYRRRSWYSGRLICL